jgi:cytochrome P450 family 3 subfamily A
VSDPDFLEGVFVKQATLFHARRITIVNVLSHNVFTTFGEKWRRQRHVINPTFSAAKLKSMSPLINGSINDLMGKLSDHVEKNDEFNIYLYFQRMTMDVICKYTLLSQIK